MHMRYTKLVDYRFVDAPLTGKLCLEGVATGAAPALTEVSAFAPALTDVSAFAPALTEASSFAPALTEASAFVPALTEASAFAPPALTDVSCPSPSFVFNPERFFFGTSTTAGCACGNVSAAS